MAEIVYSPKCFEEKESELTGTVTLIIPTLQQRLKYIEDAKVELTQSSDDVTADTAAKNTISTRILLDISKAHYKEVSIKEKKGTVSYKTFDELTEDYRCDPILMEIAWLLVRGFKPSKNSKPS